MTRGKITALLLSLCLLASGCAAEAEAEESFFAMDTVMTLKATGENAEAAVSDARAEALRLEALLSATDEGSDISAVNSANGAPTAVSSETAELLGEVLSLCAETDGALDITIYPLVLAWGFTTEEYRVPDDAELSALLENVGYDRVTLEGNTVTLPEGAQLDLGAVAKGYASDRLSALLRENGVTSALLNLGGNVMAVGSRPDGSPWRIAVREPFGEGYVGVLEAEDLAVITSGGYERYFTGEDGELYWHILDPETGRPARGGLSSVTIVGESGVLCDALSTAVFVMGKDAAEALWRSRGDFEMLLVTEDGGLCITEGLADGFTASGDYENAALEVLYR